MLIIIEWKKLLCIRTILFDIHTYPHVETYIHIHSHTHTRIGTCTHVLAHIYSCKNTHMNTYIHTYILFSKRCEYTSINPSLDAYIYFRQPNPKPLYPLSSTHTHIHNLSTQPNQLKNRSLRRYQYSVLYNEGITSSLAPGRLSLYARRPPEYAFLLMRACECASIYEVNVDIWYIFPESAWHSASFDTNSNFLRQLKFLLLLFLAQNLMTS